MIITILFLVAFVVCLIWAIKSESDESIILCSMTFIALLIVSIILVCENSFPETKKIQLEEKRKAIVYEMDHGFYVGDSLGEFNAQLKRKQRLNENPWTSWFIGDYIMEVEPIELGEK